MRYTYIWIAIILMAALILISVYMPRKIEIKCGDKICSLSEDCNSCPEDCSCKANEYCSNVGICKLKEVCGDEICSEQEKASENCCEDCGCSSNQICNKVVHKCQEQIVISEETINNAVKTYLLEKNLTGKIIQIKDSYYKEKAVKVTSIDCRKEGAEYPCSIVLFIDESGKIIEEMRTA